MANDNNIVKGYDHKRINASSRAARLETLNSVGYIDGHRVVLSKRDKARNPRLQRKRKDWLRGD